MSAIQADYRTNKHIPSRKCYQLIMEVAEENFPEVCKVLGYPATGENVYVGIARLEHGIVSDTGITVSKEQTEGERLRTRAVLLCKDAAFQEYCYKQHNFSQNEFGAKLLINHCCNIKSRAELATKPFAQDKFKELDRYYKDWLFEQQHADNLGRV
jgi:hypothetical protein